MNAMRRHFNGGGDGDGRKGGWVKLKTTSSRDFPDINLGRQQIPRVHLPDQNFPFSFPRLTISLVKGYFFLIYSNGITGLLKAMLNATLL